jgi:Glutathione S-transferase, N-terminal domain
LARIRSLREEDDVAVKLHRCSNVWVKLKAHPCWNVQSALDEQGVAYEVVKGPLLRGRRTEVERLSGQHMYPVIEFEDGSAYREESREMAETIRAGRLDEKRGGAAEAT